MINILRASVLITSVFNFQKNSSSLNMSNQYIISINFIAVLKKKFMSNVNCFGVSVYPLVVASSKNCAIVERMNWQRMKELTGIECDTIRYSINLITIYMCVRLFVSICVERNVFIRKTAYLTEPHTKTTNTMLMIQRLFNQIFFHIIMKLKKKNHNKKSHFFSRMYKSLIERLKLTA